jgi:hypothetical protein
MPPVIDNVSKLYNFMSFLIKITHLNLNLSVLRLVFPSEEHIILGSSELRGRKDRACSCRANTVVLYNVQLVNVYSAFEHNKLSFFV